jgi:hypothetical protein
MPAPVTAYSVKIASPGESAMETVLAREVIGRWNALHALTEKQVLVPVDGEGSHDLYDLLVAFFCASDGMPDARTGSLAVAEIEKHLQAARPALIYVSDARNHFAGPDAVEEAQLNDLKQRYEARAIVDTYGDEKEFRAKLARHLELTIDHHFHFVAPEPVAQPVTPPPARELSDHARRLLVEACEDFEAYLGRVKTPHSLKIQANGKQLVDPARPETFALWESAFQELLEGGFIRDVGCHGQLFQVSGKGFDYLKSIGKTPVGYIAEMGGM